MRRERLELALERTDYRSWNAFENLAAAFNAAEFSNLRTLASVSGDLGRDGILWQPGGDPSVVLQYSVTSDWRGKIRDTAKTIESNFPGTKVIVYTTSQLIGPAADDLRKSLRERGFFLDVRDRSWFLDRVNATPQNQTAAEELARLLVDPLLAERAVIAPETTSLTTHESQAAIFYLAMQLQDDTTEKGLTKVLFDALARCALRMTDNSNRMSESQVLDAIEEALPDERTLLAPYVHSALGRLVDRGVVKHWAATSDYCLSREERVRVEERVTDFAVRESALNKEIEALLDHFAVQAEVQLPTDRRPIVGQVRRIVAKVLLERGEAFASTVRTRTFRAFTLEDVRATTIADVGTHGDDLGSGSLLAPIVQTVESLLLSPSETVHLYLRSFADSYTLFAFLHATPNVQAAAVKMFADGDIWLDTSVCLPLFAEQLLDPEERRFTKLIDAGRKGGLHFFVTSGVVEEIERHMNRSLVACASDASRWRGAFPFLFTAYLWSGESAGDFPRWLENYRGERNPEDDVREALRHEWGIEMQNLGAEFEEADPDLRYAVQDEWCKVHEARRAQSGLEADQMLAIRMANHDVENYLGTIIRRKAISDSVLGYTTWWLTLDREAHAVGRRVSDRLGIPRLDSPVLSPDFLLNYIAIGPMRRQLGHGIDSSLPLILDIAVMEVVPSELLAIAEKAREGVADQPPRVIRRRVRDALDGARSRLGLMGTAGIKGAEEQLRLALTSDAG